MKCLIPCGIFLALLSLSMAACDYGDGDVFMQPIIEQRNSDVEKDKYCYNIRYRQGIVWYDHQFSSSEPSDYDDAQRSVGSYAGWYNDTASLDEVMCND